MASGRVGCHREADGAAASGSGQLWSAGGGGLPPGGWYALSVMQRWVSQGCDGFELRDTGQIGGCKPCGIFVCRIYANQALISA